MDNKNYLMLCELHHPNIHGKDENSDSNIETHYLVYDRFEPWSTISYLALEDDYETDNEYDSDSDFVDNPNHINKLQNELEFLQNKYSYPNELVLYYGNHPVIRNYDYITNNPNYIRPEIGQYIILPTHEAIAILKTFWLRIIQRKWKKIFAERKQIITLRKQTSSLYYRQIYGKWPELCNYLPSLNGMLFGL
jgi:hypothetical protein